MDAQLSALEKRVSALETDDDFTASTAPPPPGAGGDQAALDRLAEENAQLKKALAKERYRIKHLIRAVEGK